MNTIKGLGFSGASILANTNADALKSMKDGVAKLVSVEDYTSKKQNKGLKIVFDAFAPTCDGHDTYVSTQDANRLIRQLNKLAYLFVHANNPTANEKFALIPEPYMPVTDEANNTVTIKEGKEMETLRAQLGANIDVVWQGEGEQRIGIVVRENDHVQLLASLKDAISHLVGTSYRLEFKKDGNFNRIATITKAKA